MGSALGSPRKKKALHIPSIVRIASFEYQRATDGENFNFSDRQVENITRAFERIKGRCVVTNTSFLMCLLLQPNEFAVYSGLLREVIPDKGGVLQNI